MSEVIELGKALPSLDADFHDVLRTLSPPAVVRLVVLDDVPDAQVGPLLPDRSEWRTDRDQDLLLLIGDGATALDAALSDPDSLAVEVASLLQDHVMDSLNTPWPMIQRRNDPPVVAEPMLLEGKPFWGARGAPVAALGALASAV